MVNRKRIFVITGGIVYLFAAIFHFTFYHVLDWKNTLTCLSTINNTIMQMLNLCLACYFLLMGIVYLIYYREIIQSKLGRALLFMTGMFFFFRLVLEFIFPNPSLWLSGLLLVFIGINLVPSFRYK